MELRRKLRVRVFLLVAAAGALFTTAFGVLTAPTVSAAQTVPYKINFQGRLTDNNGNALTDGLYNIKFRIWTAATGGTNSWEEDRVFSASDNRVQVTGGLFNIQFGDLTALSPALFSGAYPLYLEVELPTPATATCATNGCASFTEGAMTPRQALASSAYAFNSDTLDGLDSTAFGQLGASNTFTAANLFAPGASAVVALTAKASTAGGVDSLDVYDSGGVKQAFFDATGKLNVAQTIQPTTNNGPNLGTTALAFGTLYAANVDSGSTTTTLNLGTSTATIVGLGRTAATLTEEGSTIQVGNGVTSHTIQIGSGNTGTQSITIGSSNVAADSLTLEAGNTGKIQIGNSNSAHTIQIGAGGTSTVQGVTVGSTFAGSATTLLGAGITESLATNSATFQTTTNSTAALQVENATGIPIFLVDTATSLSGNLLTYGGFEIGAGTPTGWAAIGAPTTFARNTTAPNHYGGLASLQLVTTATVANQGATTTNFNSVPGIGSYVVSFYAEVTSGSLLSGQLQAVVNGAGTTCTIGVTLSSTGFQRVICPVSAGAVITSIGIQVPSTAAAVRSIYIDAVQLVAGTSATPATNGAIQLRGAVDSPVVFQALSNSTTAFQIQNSAGTGNLFVADTLDNRVGINNSAPTTALDVTGIVNATGFSTAGTAGLASLTCSGGQLVQNASIAGGLVTAGTCVAAGGSGASTTLNNLGTTSINASLLPATNNTLDLGSTAAAWKDLYSANIDTGTITTALTIGAANAASITIGKAALAVSIPGGITTSNGTINTGSGSITTTGALSAGGITGTSVSAGTGAVTGGQHSGTNGVFTNSTAALLLGTTNTAQLNVTGSGAQVFSLGVGGTVCTSGSNCTSTYQVAGSYQAAGNYLLQAPTSTAANTVTPTTTGIVGLSVKGFNAATADVLDIYNSTATPTLQSYFNSAGAFNTSQAITAPTSGNTINNLVVNTGALSGVTGITTSGGYTQTGASANVLTGQTTINSSAFLANQFVLNDGLASVVPTIPGGYAPIEVVRSSQTSGSRPLFFGYDDNTGTGWAATLNAGACGSFTQMCFDLGSGTTTSTAFENAGTTLNVGGGDDGNFTAISFKNTGTSTFTGGVVATTFSGSGTSLTNLNPTNLTTGSGAITLQPAASTGLNLNTTGTGAITITPGTGNLAENFAAGIGEIQTATAAMTADLFDQTNTSAANAPTADGINLLQQTFFGKPSGTNNESSTRINATNSNTAAGGQVNGLRILAVGAGGAVASDTDGILVDNFTNASSAGTENGVEVGTGWDSGLFVQSGGNTIKASSTTGLLVESASALAALTVDTSANVVHIGSATADTNQILLQLDSLNTLADTATCATTTNQGALYYNSNTNAIRGCVNGNWEDVVTTSGLGILAFGVIPDSANAGAPGDIAGVSNYTNSPCKVTWLSATSVQVNPCAVYSGGRKIIVPTTTVSVASLAANAYANICFSTASGAVTTTGAPTLLTGNATETSATMPVFSPNNPVECLATVRASATAGNIGNIWDTRTFTNTQKEFATTNSVNSNGYLVIGTATAGVYQTTATTGSTLLRGTVVATTGSASGTGINSIISVKGPTFVKFLGTSTVAVNNVLETFATTAGYATSVSGTGLAISNYVYGGPLEMAISTSCTTANTPASACQYSPLIDFAPTR